MVELLATYLNLPHPTRGVVAIRRRTIYDDGDGDYGDDDDDYCKNDNADEEAKTSKYLQNRSLYSANSSFL